MYLPVESTQEEFPECPAAYLRTGADVEMLEDRFGRKPFAEHLIGGAIHPDFIVGATASEVETGARSTDTISPKVLSLIHVRFREQARKREYDSELRKRRK